MAICQCGCEEEIPHSWTHEARRKEPRFKKGHASRSPEVREKISAASGRRRGAPLPWPRVDICECGCGEVIPPSPRHRFRKPRYIHLHFLRMNNGIRGQRLKEAGERRRLQPPPGWTPPSGICECGCGGQTQIVTKHARRDQDVYIGYYRRFIRGHQARLLTRQQHSKWKSDRVAMKSGYIQVFAPDHPTAIKSGWALEHRMVYAESRGVTLPPKTLIHHINGVKSDNRPENLIALTRIEHSRAHRLANEVISLFLDDRLLDAAKAHVRQHGEMPDLETLTAKLYGTMAPA